MDCLRQHVFGVAFCLAPFWLAWWMDSARRSGGHLQVSVRLGTNSIGDVKTSQGNAEVGECVCVCACVRVCVCLCAHEGECACARV
jgi:hypothetical protein